MLEPRWIIRNRFHLVSGFENPALAPGVDQAILGGVRGNERMWDLHDDRVAILLRATVPAVIDEAEIAVGVFLELVSFPFPGAGRQIKFRRGAIFLSETPGRKVRTVI